MNVVVRVERLIQKSWCLKFILTLYDCTQGSCRLKGSYKYLPTFNNFQTQFHILDFITKSILLS